MSETPKLLLEKDGPIGWIVFNQPEKRNAVSLNVSEPMPNYVNRYTISVNVALAVFGGAGEQAIAGQHDIPLFNK